MASCAGGASCPRTRQCLAQLFFRRLRGQTRHEARVRLCSLGRRHQGYWATVQDATPRAQHRVEKSSRGRRYLFIHRKDTKTHTQRMPLGTRHADTTPKPTTLHLTGKCSPSRRVKEVGVGVTYAITKHNTPGAGLALGVEAPGAGLALGVDDAAGAGAAAATSGASVNATEILEPFKG